ncbi:hypothetical protein AMK68_05510 [candidate division KD3-62 bacterium DG_56]|uniref:ABC transporter permease n=1 Tax=candidate division KD3-62 bacterium DG_56 TaxID=1704032 RepID=A0A0S7XIS0_9BACT|nr:MAG: hypothetical protein AMK68_05510 [candidate division KD3-62 bacterium DG_56]
MKRLIAKELREHWPYIAGALVGSTGMILVVDPRFFWDRSVWGGWLAIPVLIFFVMGLSAYSREYSRETLSFALSRPVRWWWLYLAKMLAGLIACTLVAAISSGVHVAACRESYRPFLDAAGVGNGFARMAVSSGLAFVMGLALSCVVPGRLRDGHG